MLGVFGIGGRTCCPESPTFTGIHVLMIIQFVLLLIVLGLIVPNRKILRAQSIQTAGSLRFVRLARSLGIIALLFGAFLSTYGLVVVAHTLAGASGEPDPVALHEALYEKLLPLCCGLGVATIAYIEAGVFELLIERKMARG